MKRHTRDTTCREDLSSYGLAIVLAASRLQIVPDETPQCNLQLRCLGAGRRYLIKEFSRSGSATGSQGAWHLA